MRNFSSLRFSAIALTLLLFTVAANATAGSRPLITSAINEASLVTLEGNTRPEANAANDRGRVSDNLVLENLQLQLRRPAEAEQALDKYIDDLQKPNSASYHQWLTAQQYGERYGLNSADLNAISSWLKGHGFTVNVVYASGMVIDFSGTAGMIREAFHTEIHNLSVKGQNHIANMSDPRLPEALAPAVIGIAQLNDFKPHAMYQTKTNYTVNQGGTEYYIVVPSDLATIYNLNPLFSAGTTGKGQTVVVVEDSNFLKQDWLAFRSVLGLSGYTSGRLEIKHPASSGTNNCIDPGINGASGEAALDAEWSSAAAPDATIEMITCGDKGTFGGLIAVQNLLNASSAPPAIISMSYGICEAFGGSALNASFNSAFQQAVTEGVSVFVSAGDAAAAGCGRGESADTYGVGITGWGETPYNVAVGGTDFGDTYLGENSTYWSSKNNADFGSALSYVPEIPWNDSCASVLISTIEGFSTTYGSSGFCNSSTGVEFQNTVGGSGGPSGCATGKPAVQGVVSGTCKGYAKPSWQAGLGVHNDGVRDIPDVSLFAANGVWAHYYVFCDSIGGPSCTAPPVNWAGAGGTSFSSPILAGMQALVNEVNGNRQGNPNVAFYQLANNEYGTTGDAACNSTLGNGAASSCVFYDITLGDIDVDCTGSVDCYTPSGSVGVLSTSDSAYKPAYGTNVGWDGATGLGSVNAANLVSQWSTVAPKAAWEK